LSTTNHNLQNCLHKTSVQAGTDTVKRSLTAQVQAN